MPEELTQDKKLITPPELRNPEGKGGFKDHPENINVGGRPKNQESFAYWMNYFKNLSTKEFLKWEKENPDSTRNVAADLVYARMIKARNDLREFQEIANRTEGMPRQTIKNEFEDEVTGIEFKLVREKDDIKESSN